MTLIVQGAPKSSSVMFFFSNIADRYHVIFCTLFSLLYMQMS